MEVKYKIISTSLLDQCTYTLNPSKSKFISVGVVPFGKFPLAVQLSGNNQRIRFTKDEWDMLIQNEECVRNYLRTTTKPITPLVIGSKIIMHHWIGMEKVIKIIEDRNCLYLGQKSAEQLFGLKHLIENRLSILNRMELYKYFEKSINHAIDLGNKPMSDGDDLLTNLYKVLKVDRGLYEAVIIQELLYYRSFDDIMTDVMNA